MLSSSSSFGLLKSTADVPPPRDRTQRILPRFSKENPLPRGCRQSVIPVR
jgi:hypothetical protein